MSLSRALETFALPSKVLESPRELQTHASLVFAKARRSFYPARRHTAGKSLSKTAVPFFLNSLGKKEHCLRPRLLHFQIKTLPSDHVLPSISPFHASRQTIRVYYANHRLRSFFQRFQLHNVFTILNFHAAKFILASLCFSLYAVIFFSKLHSCSEHFFRDFFEMNYRHT